jgi:hypothetical protein
MKRYGVEQQSADLLGQLHQLNLDSPLEAVYSHLHNKYVEIEKANREILNIFTDLNSMFAGLESNITETRDLVYLYKQIRALHLNHKNHTSQVVLNTTKASLVLLANQKQLLKDGSHNLGQLLSDCKNGVEGLPFGFMRFYLKNIVDQLRIMFKYQQNQIEEAKSIYTNCKSKNFYNANNLNFPSKELRSIKSLLEEKEIQLESLNDYQFGIGKLRFNQAMEKAFNKNYFGRERLSLFLN